MLETTINNSISQATKTLTDSKNQIRDLKSSLSKQATEEIGISPDRLTNELSSITSDTQEILQRAQNNYNKYVRLIDQPIRKIIEVENKVNKIKVGLEKIVNIFESSIGELLTLIDYLINLFKQIIIAIRAALLLLQGPTANGATITNFYDKQKKLDERTRKFRKLITFFTNIFTGNPEKGKKGLIGYAKDLLEELKKVTDFIRKQKLKAIEIQFQIYGAFGDFIIKLKEKGQEKWEIFLYGDPEDEEDTGLLGDTPLEDYVRDPSKLETIIPDLIEAGNNRGTELFASATSEYQQTYADNFDQLSGDFYL